MRIGLSTAVMDRGRSGVGQYVLALVRALLADDPGRHEYFLFVLAADLPLFAFAGPAVHLVTVPERHRPALRNVLWHQWHLPRLARRLRLDVLHVPSYRRLPWSRPCALVATIHDLAPFRFPGKYDLARMLYGRLVVPWLARRQDAVIAVSAFTAADVRRHLGVTAERLRVIPNGLDHERFSPGPRLLARSAVARRHGLVRPFFLYVARLEHPAKNHVRLLAAFDGFKAATGSAWQLVLAGSDWHGAATVHARIRRSPFAADIRCLGFVADTALPALYRAAELLVFPSLFEGFGLPPLEAMACGCPVLSSARGALAETLGGAAASLDPDDTAQIRDSLIRLAGDEGARAELSRRGLLRAALHDWRRTAAATLDTYTRAAAGAADRVAAASPAGSAPPARSCSHASES